MHVSSYPNVVVSLSLCDFNVETVKTKRLII
jgi:hypothetical protein